MKPQNGNRSYWKEQILEAAASGLSMTAWCREHGISRDAFRSHKDALIKCGELPESVMKVRRVKKRSREEWKAIILEATSSGLPIRAWCKEHGISETVFSRQKSALIDNGDLPASMKQAHSREEWKAIILEAAASGLSMTAWCSKHGISGSTFRSHKDALIKCGELPESVIKVRRVKRRSREEWKAIILEATSSGLSIRAWCKEHGIEVSHFRRRREILIDNGDLPESIRPAKAKVRSREEWKAIILEAASSGLPMAAWCQERGISISSFFGHKRALIERGELPKSMKGPQASERRCEQWKELILEAATSTQPVYRWCEQHHTSPSTFYNWRNTLIERGEINSDLPATKYKEETLRKKLEYWKKIIIEAAASGQPMTSWCKQHHIGREVFCNWRKILTERGEINSDLPVTRYKEETLRKKLEYWKKFIIEAAASGRSMTSWRKQYHIGWKVFCKWRKILIERGEINSDLLVSRYKEERRREKLECWKKIIIEAAASTQPAYSWCEQRHIGYSAFFKWRKILIERGEINSDLPVTRYKEETLRKKLEYWEKIIIEADASNQTIVDWCKQRHIHSDVFYKWRKILIERGEISQDVCKNPTNREKVWKERILTGAASGLSRGVWCAKNQVSRSSLNGWIRVFIKRDELPPDVWPPRRSLKKRIPKDEPKIKEASVFCELPAFEEQGDSRIISQGTQFRIGKFSLLMEENVSEDEVDIVLEILNTIGEVTSDA